MNRLETKFKECLVKIRQHKVDNDIEGRNWESVLITYAADVSGISRSTYEWYVTNKQDTKSLAATVFGFVLDVFYAELYGLKSVHTGTSLIKLYKTLGLSEES